MKLHEQKAHPKHPEPGLDPHLEAACRQRHSFPELTVWERCFSVSGNPFGFPRPEHGSSALGTGTAIADRTLDVEQLMGILYPSIIHVLLEIKVPTLKPGVSLKYKSSSIGFRETAQDLNYACV